MEKEQQARFEQLPGNITLNSLYIPGSGASHIIMGSSNSKQEALQAIHKHLSAFGVQLHGEATPDILPWKDIPKRDTSYPSRGYDTLPIRSQRGVVANLANNSFGHSMTAKIYSDDYATGQIPWTIRVSHTWPISHEEVFNHHNMIKEYFKHEGNQKTSWKERYNAK